MEVLQFRHMKYKKMGFKLQRENHDKYRLWFEEKFLEFSRFSDVLTGNQSIKLIPYKLELLTHNKRKGKCHFRSFYFVHSLGGILETSYVDDSSGKSRVVHSYIRRKNKIIDYTSNLVISESIKISLCSGNKQSFYSVSCFFFFVFMILSIVI